MPGKVSAKKYAIALYEATKGQADRESVSVVKKLVMVLVRQNALSLATQIIAEFENYSLEQKGAVLAEIISAQKLSHNSLVGITKTLEKKLRKKVAVKTTIQKNLIGGIIIKLKDKLIDCSIKGQLAALKNNLIS